MKDLGVELDKVEMNQLGQAKLVRVDNDNTTIIEGAGSSEAIQGRIEQIRREIETTTSDYDREKLQERLAKLARRRGSDQRGRCHGGGTEGKEGPHRGCPARHPRRGGRRRRPRRRRGPMIRAMKALDGANLGLEGR